MSVDLSKIRPGDEVTFTAKVVLTRLRASTGPLGVTIEDGGGLCDIPADLISAHTPKALQVGDRVKLANGAAPVGVVVGRDDEYAWVRWPYTPSPITEAVANLERAP